MFTEVARLVQPDTRGDDDQDKGFDKNCWVGPWDYLYSGGLGLSHRELYVMIFIWGLGPRAHLVVLPWRARGTPDPRGTNLQIWQSGPSQSLLLRGRSSPFLLHHGSTRSANNEFSMHAATALGVAQRSQSKRHGARLLPCACQSQQQQHRREPSTNQHRLDLGESPGCSTRECSLRKFLLRALGPKPSWVRKDPSGPRTHR